MACGLPVVCKGLPEVKGWPGVFSTIPRWLASKVADAAKMKKEEELPLQEMADFLVGKTWADRATQLVEAIS
jgi:hypothetical protein